MSRTNKAPTLKAEVLPVALFRLILWLMHAVLAAFASALVDVFTNATAALVALVVMAFAAFGIAGAFGFGGFGLFRRLRRRG